MDNARRVFRGRGGPTDRRLPKYNARRRKAPKEKSETVSVSNDDDRCFPASEETHVGTEELLEEEEEAPAIVIHEQEAPRIVSFVNKQHQVLEESDEFMDQHDTEIDATRINCQKEMKHLIQRVRHVRESISLSAKAISDTDIYEQNVLNAAVNCVNEWRSIVNHYSDIFMDEAVISKATSLQIFELIQQTLQCGPLAGAKPGYFKRCEGSVALMALQFLNSIAPDQDAARMLLFTARQADAIDKWKQNARKALERA
jgi:hypothetical protein